MSIENLSEDEIRRIEADNRRQSTKIRPIYQHYGSIENLSEDEIRIIEADNRRQSTMIRPIYQHYGSIENLSEDETRIIEAQVSEQRKKDAPYKEYFNNLIANPNIADNQQFEDAVIRSMQSNEIMREFTLRLVEEISKATYGFKHIEKNDIEKINNQKQKIENLVNVYVRYLYALKSYGWVFYGPGNYIGLEMISSAMVKDLWQVQKYFNLTFNMSIPKDLGEYYGKAFERKGKMIDAISLMYDDLKNKDVNWHQVLIYKENELTPRQRYMQRREAAINQFNSARQAETKEALAQIKSNIENPEKINTTSIRR